MKLIHTADWHLGKNIEWHSRLEEQRLFLKDFINIDGKGFEYETNMILYCLKNNINIEEIPIDTIYLENNIRSRFHPVKDSIAIAINVLKHLKKN